MTDPAAPASLPETLMDFITGRPVPHAGAEANRQAVERRLVEEKGYAKSDIEVDVPITVNVPEGSYSSRLDLVVRVDGRRRMVVKCAAGSLGSRERETVAAARLLESEPLPLALVSDGESVTVLDAGTGKVLGSGWERVPGPNGLRDRTSLPPLSADRRQRESLIFRSYDGMIVNRA